MTIEEDIFKRCKINYDRLEKYGFQLSQNTWIYSTLFRNGEFKANVSVDNKGCICGNVYEIVTDDIFLPLRVEGMGGFLAEVRQAYINILEDIKEKCFYENFFISAQANRLAQNIYERYGDKPVFPWDDFSGGVFKNPDNGKWYAIVMAINVQKVDKKLTGEVEVVNIKLNPDKIKELHKQKGFYPAYHMNKKYWISILLNDIVPDDFLFELLDESHHFALKKSR